jgi:two-component system response regulator YesN
MEHFNVLGAHTLSEFFIELTRQSARSVFAAGRGGEGVSERINAVLLYLHTSYMHPISSADIERELSYNFDYLNQLFAKHLHVSIFKLLENVRMEAAKHILQTSALSVKELAGEVGYSDEAYFSKVFKRRVGCTPSEYRRGEKADF